MRLLFCRSRGVGPLKASSRRSTTYMSILPLVLGFALVWPFGGGKTVHMMAGSETPGARGDVQLKTENGNTSVNVQAHALAKPTSLSPAQNVYVLWIQAPDQQPQNQGQLQVGKHEDGELQVKTPFTRFSVFITAEQNPTVQTPSGPKVLSADVSHE